MKKEDILKMANVIPISENSQNIIFLDNSVISRKSGEDLAKAIGKNNVNFGAIVFVEDNPHLAVKLVSAENIEEITNATTQ